MSKEPRGCLANLLGGFLGGGSSHKSDAGPAMPPVMVSKKFMSPAEINFYRVLDQTVGDRGIIFAQVSLNQLLYLPGNNKSQPGRQTWQNKIARRAIDFVVCDIKTLRPAVAIELDDASHAAARRESRDEENDRLFDAAGLTLLHVVASKAYDTRELEATIGACLG